jgi:hypothetical protein
MVTVKVIARRTLSNLLALGRRDKLSECEDLQSKVVYAPVKTKGIGFMNEKEFVKKYTYFGTAKSLKF